MRKKPMITSEAQEAREKADKAAVVFGNGGGQIIVSDFAGHAAHRVKGVNVTASEGFKALAVSELDVECPAVSID